MIKESKKINSKNKKSVGITLIEMTVVLGIFSVALVAVTTYVWLGLRVQDKSIKHILAQNSARKAMTSIAAEIRSGMYSDAGSYAINTAEANTLTFYTNIDSDINAERVRYFMDGSNLKRGVVEPQGDPPNYNGTENVTTLARYIINTDNIFSYYDRNYQGTANPLSFPVNKSLIRLVRISLTIDIDINRLPDPVTVTTEAQLRNLKDNL